MIPKIHAKGRSFRGAALYLLHDKDRARTSERVAWTETRNLASENPHVAWRLMAATAMDADRLKQQAGLKNTGRKSTDSVLHLTLSWHPTEKEGLSREEMLRAATDALKALQADDRQALLVCHDDEPQPHVHILVNRVSAETGRMLSSSREKLALSAWAQQYEQDRGHVLCQDRVVNNAARGRGEYTRGEPDQSRHLLEDQASLKEKGERLAQVQRQERAKDALLARQQREQKERHRAAWEKLSHDHAQALKSINRDKDAHQRLAQAAIQSSYQRRWDELRKQHDEQTRAFAAGEKTPWGRLRNGLRTTDLRRLLVSETRKGTIQQIGQALASRAVREEAIRLRQERDARDLQAKQRSEEEQQSEAIRTRHQAALAQERARFLRVRDALMRARQQDALLNRQCWQAREQERTSAVTRSRTAQEQSNQFDRLRERLREQRERQQHRHDHSRGMGL